MPPHIAEAVPIGIWREASSSRLMLSATEARNPSVHGRLRNPSTWRRHVVNPTSNTPPRSSHTLPLSEELRVGNACVCTFRSRFSPYLLQLIFLSFFFFFLFFFFFFLFF